VHLTEAVTSAIRRISGAVHARVNRPVFALRATPGTLRCSATARLRHAWPKGEAWWACLDSNQEPDRYERPALTIELQAPPQAAVRDGRQRCRHRLQGRAHSRNATGQKRRLVFNTVYAMIARNLAVGDET
jgi:hypothetical protein